MREIKFRAWDVETKQMRFGEDIFVQFDGKRIVCDNYKFWESQCAVIGFEDCVDDITHGVYLMQFTGLCDKNGREIYESDVVRNWQGGWNVVVYKYPAFEATVSADQSSSYSREWWASVEVIGNIHANPDLLK